MGPETPVQGGVFLDPHDVDGFPFKAIFGIMPAATAAWGRLPPRP